MKLASNASFAVMIFALGITGCSAPETRAPSDAGSISSAETGTVTSIRNAGAIAELGEGEDAIKVLFDPLYDNHFGSLAELDDALIEKIVLGKAPYDGVSAVFVSHAHGDHFSARHLSRLLAAQPEVTLVAPEPAIAAMRKVSEWQDGFADRVRAITLENGQAAETFTIADATVEAFRSPHAGWPERHKTVHNLTFRVSASTGSDGAQRVMHLGDADPGVEFFAPHKRFLESKRTGLALVPFWFFREENKDALIGSVLNAESVTGIHVPQETPGWLGESDHSHFTAEGQRADVPTTR